MMDIANCSNPMKQELDLTDLSFCAITHTKRTNTFTTERQGKNALFLTGKFLSFQMAFWSIYFSFELRIGPL